MYAKTLILDESCIPEPRNVLISGVKGPLVGHL